MEEVYLLSAARTAIGTFGGTLAAVPSTKLGSLVIAEAMRRASVEPSWVDEVIMGCVLQAGLGQGPARLASIEAGLPDTVPAWTLNNICGSGLKSVAVASALIKSGEAQCLVAGGMENMSRAPYVAEFVREPHKMGPVEMRDTMLTDGLTDVFSGQHMGLTAEAVAEKYALTRQELDEFAAASQVKAGKAIAEGAFAEEIIPVIIPQRKGDPIVFKVDEHPRPNTTPEILAKLRPAFKPDGIVTAGNASGLNDGAAALVVASGSFVKEHALHPLARLAAAASTALDPRYMGLGPIEATRKALAKADWTVEELDLAEVNEAFASQSIAVLRELKLNSGIVNVNGGAIALGHPIGASGARILTSLLYGLKHRGGRKGLATLCVGGGMGVAVLVEMV